MQYDNWKHERPRFLTREQWQQLDDELRFIEQRYNQPSRWGRCHNFLLYVLHRIGWPLVVLLTLPGPRIGAQTLPATDDQAWEQVRSEDGITVFRRSVPDRSIDEVRVLATFPVPRARVVTMLSQVDRYPAWVYKCSEATLVKRLGQNEILYHTSIDLPWPVVDRDVVIHSRNWTEAGTGDILSESEAVKKTYPRVADHVRMTDFHSSWRISATGENETTIDYRVSSDVGGNLPNWLINLGITTGPWNSIRQLKALLLADS
ncbi:hypothetical protein LEM8419_03435 [Neolewinella maritima]|uniref:START domain-containing protein n=1 Tax=Neolewinella maritima TaxID=1383882 RepID=A0ABM9B5R7_9BACT|nr:START domain-containing protein [Neolewinella maritima]CAH1002561.1 hypothetical protein LEM8419_03435 [Neolewinella maritima]